MILRFFIICFTILVTVLNLHAQSADDIKGYWITSDGEGQVKIFKSTNGKYYGRITWLNHPFNDDGTLKRDVYNPDDKIRGGEVIGLLFLKSFEFNEKTKRWENGTVYDPNNGKTYRCNLWICSNNKNKLYLKGYIGITLIGRKEIWFRESKLRK